MTAPTAQPSNIPLAARKQIKEANRLIQELNAKPGEVVPNLTAASRPGFVAAPPSATAPPSTAPVAAAPSAAAVPVVEDPLKIAEHKYSVLAGKYNSEIARVTGRAEQLAADNAVLLSRLQAQPAPPAPARVEDRFDLTVVTPKEREEFGEELVQMMARIAKANSGAEVDRLSREIASMRGQVQQTQQIGVESRREKIWAQLDAKIPDWRVINNSQQFVDWLQNIDIMSGRPRQEGLSQAFEAGDGSRVVGIFSRFVQEDSSSRPTPDAPAAALVDQGTLVAPAAGRGGSQEAPNGSSGKIWSEQEINDFYSRVQRGRIGSEEKKALEAEIMAAVTSGRVVPTRNDSHLANSR